MGSNYWIPCKVLHIDLIFENIFLKVFLQILTDVFSTWNFLINDLTSLRYQKYFKVIRSPKMKCTFLSSRDLFINEFDISF